MLNIQTNRKMTFLELFPYVLHAHKPTYKPPHTLFNHCHSPKPRLNRRATSPPFPLPSSSSPAAEETESQLKNGRGSERKG